MALLIAMLTGAAQAGVVENPEDVPRDFGDDPPTGIYAKDRKPGSGSTTVKVPAVHSSAGSGSLRSTAQARQRSENQEKNKGNGKNTGSEAAGNSTGARDGYPNVPGSNETWPLLAIAVLLLLAAGGGGYYLYSSSDGE